MQQLISLVKGWEGFSPEPYLCPAGKWTIGYGHLLPGVLTKRDAQRCYPEPLSLDQAEKLLLSDLGPSLQQVARLTQGSPTTDAQHWAMASFVFNLGGGALRISSLLRLHKAGERRPSNLTRAQLQQASRRQQLPQNAADQFLAWAWMGPKGAKQWTPGLFNRRWEERALYLSSIAGSTAAD